MKPFTVAAFVLTLAMVWVGFASNAFAFEGAGHAIMDTHSSHDMPMASMHIQDCPNHKTGKMGMDSNRCALYCYGLTATTIFEPLSVPSDRLHTEDAPLATIHQLMPSRSLGVPTPPPNFA